MHRTSQSTIETCFAGKNFCQSSVYKETACQFFGCTVKVFFYHCQYSSIKERFHNFHQLLVIEFVYCRHTFCKDFAVRTVTTKNKIINCQRPCHTNGSRFLSDRQVSRAGVVIRSSIVFSFGFDQIDHGFKLTNQHHVMINGFKFFVGKITFFVFDGFLILINWNRLKFHKTRLTCY